MKPLGITIQTSEHSDWNLIYKICNVSHHVLQMILWQRHQQTKSLKTHVTACVGRL